MFAALSIETEIAAITAEHKVSASALAALDGGVSSATLSKASSGQAQLSLEKEQSLRQTLGAIRSIINEYPQLPIDFNQVSKIKPLVDQRRRELREQTDPIIRRCTLIRVTYTGFFLRVQNGEVVTTPSEMIAAAFESPDLAQTVVRELKKLGTEARAESFGAFRRMSTMSNSLVELGFEPTAIGGTDGTTDNQAS
jgi:hypothetical protein